MAELGAVLFIFGWWAGDLLPSKPARPSPPGRIGLLAVGLFAATMLSLQAPRADRLVFAYDGMAAFIGPPTPGPVALRTPADLEAQARTQRTALAELDRLEASARRGEINREAIRTAIRWHDIPGMPPHLPNFDPSEMLDIPADPQHPR